MLPKRFLHLHTSASPTCLSLAPHHCSPPAPVPSMRSRRQLCSSGWPVAVIEPAGSEDIGVVTHLDIVRCQGAQQRPQAPLSTLQLASVRGSLMPAEELLYPGLNFAPPAPISSPSLKVCPIPTPRSSLPFFSIPPLIHQSSPLPNWMEPKSSMKFATYHALGCMLYTALDIALWASGSTSDATLLPNRQYFSSLHPPPHPTNSPTTNL